MGCQGYQRKFTAYLDGELERSQREAIDRHVRSCAACRRDLETLRQTVALLHSPLLPVEDAPLRVQAALAQKIRAVRQPMSWLERLRLQWRVAGMAAQARAWGYGMAATAFLFVAGAGSFSQLQAPGQTLAVGGGLPGSVNPAPARTVSPPSPDSGAVPAPALAMPGSARIRAWVETPVVVGRSTTVYLFVEPGRNLADGEVRLFPAAGVSVGGAAVPQEDASYLLYRGPVMGGGQQAQWIPAVLRASQEGVCTLRVLLRDAGRLVAEERVSFTAVAPQD